MRYPLISVIVPVYKVEQYLHRCVDSILAQTYPHIEVVLVDDGSPDRCGAICDEYAQADRRVQVVHRPNGGLSAARNSGLDVCRGEYIGFVDSDDYISTEMYMQLYHDITLYKTLLAFCHSDVRHGNHGDNKHYGQGSEARSKSYVMSRSLNESIWWSAWTKLYHKSLFEGIRYPEGKTNEDLPVTIRIFDRCDHIAINYNKLYYYCIRDGSITTSRLNPHKFDILDNASDVLGLLLRLRNYTDDDLAPQRQKTIQIVKASWPKLLCNSHLNATQRFLLSAARLSPKLLYRCYGLIKKFK